MEQVPQPSVYRNPLSSTIRAQERVSYIREDDAFYPSDNFFQQQVPTSSNFNSISSRPHNLSLHVETPDEGFSESRGQSLTYDGNIAYVKPITREVLSPIEGPLKFQSGQDEFLIFGTSRRLRSQIYDGISKEEDVLMREQKLAIREAELQRQIEEEEKRRRIQGLERMEQEERLQKAAYISKEEDVLMREQKLAIREAELQRQIEEEEKRRRIQGFERMEQEERLQKAAYIDDDSDKYDEEIIEDIITTRRKPQVQAITPMTYHAPEPTKVMSSIGFTGSA
ncbi:hypothetical protein Aperf_G00000013027 [Anoplocephala perfoliata]